MQRVREARSRALPALIAVSLTISACVSDDPSTKLILIFADVSESTDVSTNEINARTTAIVESFEPPASFHVFGIHARTLGASVVHSSDHPLPNSSQEAKSKKDNAIQSITSGLQQVRNTAGQVRLKSCILESLQRATQSMPAAADPPPQVYLYYLSDMLEDCATVQFPRGKRGADAAKPVLAARFGESYNDKKIINLTGARITLCRTVADPDSLARPQSGDTGPMANWSESDLRGFWDEVFKEAGASPPQWPSSESCVPRAQDGL